MTASRIRAALPALALTILGCIQMVGDLTNLSVLKGLGTATAASPAPKVFTAHRGFETYSSRFLLHWTDTAGQRRELRLTPAVYAGVKGPYNRRNAYGAALSYAPVLQASELTRPLHDAAMHYAFCGASSILAEIGIDRATIASPIQVELQPRQALPEGHSWQLTYEVNCHAQ